MSSGFTLLGDPVSHSVSPRIYDAAFDALGLDATYAAERVVVDSLAVALWRAARRGGGNVTLPHKGAVARLVEQPCPTVRRTGACSCFWMTPDGALAGENTDVAGFRAAVDELLPGVLDGGRILVLGAGGAARAVVVACLEAGAACIELFNRSNENALELVRGVAPDAPNVRVLSRASDAGPAGLVVNATSLGLRADDPLPLEPERLGPAAVLDLVYAPGGTIWSRAARRHGAAATDGLTMLVHQAAASIRCWFPDAEPPLGAMRAAAESALAERGGGS